MKLHLPKMLLTAVLAVVAGSGVSSGITVNDNYYVSIDTRQETATYDDASFSYTGDTITIKGQNVKVFDAIITLDYDAFAGVTTNTDILYVNTNSQPWGFRATTDGDVTGKWQASGEFEKDASIMSPGDLQALATGSGDNQIISGLKVKFNSTDVGASLTTFTGESVFVCSGLKAGNATFSSVKLNKALVSSITLVDAPREGYKGATNTKGNWFHSFETATTSFLEGNGKHEVNNTENKKGHLASKDIVVGSATQLFLQSWGNGKDLDVLSNIYVGSTTYAETGEGAKHNNAALRFGNDDKVDGGQITNIKGNIYIVEDTKFSSETTKIKNINGVNTTLTPSSINFEGDVTDVVDGMDTNSTLTLRGEGYVFKGAVNLSGLVLQSGSAATFSSASATIGALTTGGTVTNTGSLAVTGTLNLQNAITNSGSLNLNGATLELGGNANFFTKVSGDVDGNGFARGSATVYTNSGDSSTVSAEIAGVTVNGVTITSDKYTLSDGVLTVNDDNTYWIYNDTDYSKISSAVSGDQNANKTVRVTAGKTYDLKGTAAYNKVVLEAGATLANTGNNIGSEIVQGNTYNYCNERQNYYIELAGDANMSATGSYAMVAGDHECSTLKLNGHTLTKKGTGTVVLNSTVADAGTIAITAGKIWLNEHNDAKKSDLDEVAFTMSSGTTLRSIDSMTIKSLSSSGGSITVDSGKKLTVTGALALGAGTSQLSGSLKAADMTVSDGGKLSMTTGSVLDLTGKLSNLTGNSGELDNYITLANSVTTNGTAYVLMTGSSAGDNANLSGNQTLTSNAVFTNNLNINGRGWDNGKSYDFTVDGGATLKVGVNGAGQLALMTKADFIIANGSVTAGLVKLGYGSTGAKYDAFGTISLSNATSKLIAEKIEFQANGENDYANTSNALTMTAGTLEFTGDGAVFTGNNDKAVGNVSISGGEVVVNKNQSMDTVTGKRGVSLSNMKFNIAADKSMSLDSGVAISDDVTVKGSGTLKFAGSNDLSSMGGTVKVTESAKVQYQNGAVQVAAKSAEGTASVTSAAIADAAVTVGGTADVTLAQSLSNADLTYTGANKLTVTGTGSSLSSLTAQGNVDIMSAAATQQLNAITIGAGKTVGIYTGDVAEAITSSESTITTGSLTAGVDSVLNANLVLSDGATVTMADALTMGSTLTLGEGMTLSGDLVNTIKSMSEDGIVDLFTGVDALYLGDSTTASGALDATSGVNLSMYFNFEGASNYYLGYADKKVFAGIQSVPEPTTATLSLLALAGLAARRRRK